MTKAFFLRYTIFFSVFLLSFFLFACGKNYNQQDVNSEVFLKYISKNKRLPSQIPPARSFSDNTVETKDNLSITSQQLIAYIQANALPSEDRFEADNLDIQERKSYWQLLPKVLLNVSVNNPIYGYESEFYQDNDIWDSIYTYVSVAWNVNIFSQYKKIKQNEAEKLLHAVTTTINKEQLALKAMEIYYTLITTKAEVALKAKQKEHAEKTLAQISQAQGSSLYTSYDINNARIRVSSIELERNQLEFNMQADLKKLGILLESERSFSLDDTNEMQFETPRYNLEQWKELAQRNNTQVKLAALASKKLREAESLIQFERFSNVNFRVSLPNISPLSRNTSDYNTTTNFGLYWSIPIFDAGTEKFNFEEIALEKRKLAFKIRRDMEKIEQVIENTYHQCKHLEKSLIQQKQILNALRKNRNYLRALVSEGKGKQNDVDTIEIDILHKELEIKKATFKIINGYFTLRLLAGEIQL